MVDIRTVVDNLPIAVVAVNEDRKVILANRAAEMVAGLEESAMLSRRGGEVLGCVHSTDVPEGCGYGPACQYCGIKNAVVTAFRENRNIPPFESELDLLSVGKRNFRVSVTHIGKDYKTIDGTREPVAVLTIEDVTEFKQSERLGAAMVTIGAVCHEMNQPLMACLGQLELMRLSSTPDLSRLPLVMEQLNRLVELSRRLQSIRHYATRSHDSSNNLILDVPKSH